MNDNNVCGFCKHYDAFWSDIFHEKCHWGYCALNKNDSQSEDSGCLMFSVELTKKWKGSDYDSKFKEDSIYNS